jgi:hypothetical protein
MSMAAASRWVVCKVALSAVACFRHVMNLALTSIVWWMAFEGSTIVSP